MVKEISFGIKGLRKEKPKATQKEGKEKVVTEGLWFKIFPTACFHGIRRKNIPT